MRHRFSVVLFFSLAIALLTYSCKKNTETPTPSIFTIAGVTNVTLDKDSSVTIPLSITQVSGDVHSIVLSISGLPAKVSGSFSKVKETPPFTSYLTLSSAKAAVGTYNIQITGSSPGSSKTYSFDLIVKETLSCIDTSFLGNKQGRDHCASFQQLYGVYINKDPNHPNRMHIMNFADLGTVSQVYSDLDCTSKTLNIPAQTVPGNMILSGTGTFTTSPFKMIVSYTVTNGSFTDHCTTDIQ